MRNLFIKTLAGASLALFTMTANAQYQPRDYRYQERNYDRRDWIFNRLRGDLDRAESNTLPFVGDFTGDRARISRARQEVNDFQRAWGFGDYDRRELNQAIRAVQNVLDENNLSDRTRNALMMDLNRLRDFRANQQGWR